MAGRGPAPKLERRNKSDVPIRGEWQPVPGSGWQYGERPRPPSGLLLSTRAVWDTWLGAWWASHWTPEHLPQLVVTIRLYDLFARGDAKAAPELRQMMDGLGISFKGQQDRRWATPKGDDKPQAESGPELDPYSKLRVVS